MDPNGYIWTGSANPSFVGCKSSRRSLANLTPERNAYFAGLIDGEGHLALEKNQDRRVPLWNVPTIVVAMTCRATIEACQSYFSCGSVNVKSNSGRLRRKTLYGWTVRWNDARFVAEQIRPYMITRAAEADKIINAPRYRAGPERRFSDEVVREIRAARGMLGLSYAALGRRFGVGAMTAWKIANGKMYADVA